MGLSCPFWSTVLQCGARLPIYTLNYLTVQSVVPGFQLAVCSSVALFIVDPWQYCVFCIISGVTPCTLLMMLYLDRMCQCGLLAVLWSHFDSLMRRLAAEPRSTARLFIPSQCPSGKILLTPYSMARDMLVSRAGPMLYYCPKLLNPFDILLLFSPSLRSVYIGWYCGAGVFGLMRYMSLSLNLALQTFFNNNNNNNNNNISI